MLEKILSGRSGGLRALRTAVLGLSLLTALPGCKKNSFVLISDDRGAVADVVAGSDANGSDGMQAESADSLDVADRDPATDSTTPTHPCDSPASQDFCAPCENNEDCKSGFCVTSRTGEVCSKTCNNEDDCAPGWNCNDVSTAGADPVYICTDAHKSFCAPCDDNETCGSDAACEGDADETGSFCATSCATDEWCPEDGVCEDGVCVSADDECACSHWAEGKTTLCVVENANGTCSGVRACVNDVLTPCSARIPASETCNGVDDDCDGETDELNITTPNGVTITGTGKDCGIGVCAGGKTVCSTDGSAVECNTNGKAAAEICDGLDNDCDGETDATDEGLKPVPCELTKGVCAGAVTTADMCEQGEWQVCDSELYGNDYEPVETRCDGLDNDCDGETDEGLSSDADGDSFTSPASCLGSRNDCDDGNASIHPNATETCNGVDDDCDGKTDENTVGEGLSCATDQPGICGPGTLTCVEGSLSCESNTVAQAEACNGVDDDCDGETDEGLSGDADGDSFTSPASCLGSRNDCDDGNASIHPNATETCNGVDDDCDGKTDEAGADGCNQFYADADNDGHGTATTQCLCEPNGIFTAASPGDCDDADPRAIPGQSDFFSTPRPNGSYDFNCDGKVTLQFPNGNLVAACATAEATGCATNPTEGWAETPPACGEEATWVKGCYKDLAGCNLAVGPEGGMMKKQGCN